MLRSIPTLNVGSVVKCTAEESQMSLRALVRIVPLFSTLVARNLIQWPEALPASRIGDSAVFVIASVHTTVVVVELHSGVVLLLLQLCWHFVARYCLVPCLATIVTYNISLLCLLCWILNRQVELRMHKFALGSIGTKPAKVVDAHDASCVSVATAWAMTAEPSIVPGAIFNLCFGIYVEKWALLVATRVETRVEVTLWHFRHVELVKELALVAFLAKASKPVFTYNCSVTLNMPKGARRSFAAVSLNIETAHGSPRFVHTRER